MYPVGTTPKYVYIFDLNLDGIPDIITANFQSNDVSILLGVGDGTFQPAVNYAVGTSPTSIAVADFNEDGFPDIAVANVLKNCDTCTESISLLLGNGDGTFRMPAIGIPVAGSNAAVAAADLDRDGHADLIAGDGTLIYVLLGVGDGTFHTPIGFPSGGNVSHNIVVDDFDHDGNLDIASSNYNSANVTVLFGDGSGRLSSPTAYPVGAKPHEVVQGDINGDGIIDLISANQNANSVTVLFGNLDGTFGSTLSYSSSPNPSSIAAADFNGDGRLDLAIADSGCVSGGTCSTADSGAVIALNNGDGTFSRGKKYAIGTGAAAIRSFDLNGDGKADLVIGCLGLNSVEVLLGNGDGTFR